MKIPPIDLSKLLLLLKSEGRIELMNAASRKLGALTLLREWDNILTVLEKEVIPLLSKGCEAKSLLAPAQKIAKSAQALAALCSGTHRDCLFVGFGNNMFQHRKYSWRLL